MRTVSSYFGLNDIIKVAAGTYVEQNNITLQGAGSNVTRIECGGEEIPSLRKKVSGGTIAGFTVTNTRKTPFADSWSPAAIYLIKSVFTVRDNAIVGAHLWRRNPDFMPILMLCYSNPLSPFL